MYIERKEDLSMYYWLVNLFSDAPFVHIVDAFPDTELDLPTISVEAEAISSNQLELGNRTQEKYRVYTIDVFALNKSQRDDFGYRIFNALDNPINIYDYDVGFPPDTLPPVINCYDVIEKKLTNIKVYPELVEKMHYRCEIRILVTLNQV